MDLGFVIPFALVTGIGLLRRSPWATRSGYAIAGPQGLLASAVSGMAIRMWVRNDPAISPALLVVSTISAVAFMTMYAVLIRAIARSGFRSHSAPSIDIGTRRQAPSLTLHAR